METGQMGQQKRTYQMGDGDTVRHIQTGAVWRVTRVRYLGENLYLDVQSMDGKLGLQAPASEFAPILPAPNWGSRIIWAVVIAGILLSTVWTVRLVWAAPIPLPDPMAHWDTIPGPERGANDPFLYVYDLCRDRPAEGVPNPCQATIELPATMTGVERMWLGCEVKGEAQREYGKPESARGDSGLALGQAQVRSDVHTAPMARLGWDIGRERDRLEYARDRLFAYQGWSGPWVTCSQLAGFR